MNFEIYNNNYLIILNILFIKYEFYNCIKILKNIYIYKNLKILKKILCKYIHFVKKKKIKLKFETFESIILN